MQDFTDLNLAELQRMDPDLLRELKGVDCPSWPVETARKGGLTLKLGEHHVHSPYDPGREAQRLAEGPQVPLHLHFGLGLGHLLAADRPAPGGAILILEPLRELVVLALRWTPLAQLLVERNALLCCSIPRFQKLLGRLHNADQAQRLLVLPFHQSQLPQLLTQVQNCIETAVFQSQIAARSLERNSAYLTAGSLRGLVHATQLPGVQRLAGAFANLPAVLVSAGPSLDRNLADLIPYRDRCLIITVSRAARSLERLGIAPHLLVHNEPKPFLSFIEGCTNLAETCFALSLQAEVGFYQFPHGHTFVFQGPLDFAGQWFHSRYPHVAEGVLDTGGSVSNDAFSLAVLAGCNPIILIGQDLAIAGERYYAAGEENVKFSHTQADLLRVPGYYGQPVTSLSTYYSYAQWLAQHAAELQGSRPELLLINATEGGVLIPGFHNQKLRDVAWRFFRSPVAIQPRLAEAAQLSQKQRLAPAELAQLYDECRRRLDELTTLQAQFQAYETAAPMPSAKADRALDRFSDRYLEHNRDFYVLSGFMQAELRAANRNARERDAGPEGSDQARLARTAHLREILAATAVGVARMRQALDGLLSANGTRS